MSLKYIDALTKDSSIEAVKSYMVAMKVELGNIDKDALFNGIDLEAEPDPQRALLDIVKKNPSRYGFVEDYKLWIDLLNKYDLWEDYFDSLRGFYVYHYRNE